MLAALNLILVLIAAAPNKDILQRVNEIHSQEIQRGLSIFATTSDDLDANHSSKINHISKSKINNNISNDISNNSQKCSNDDDFITRFAGNGNAGTDATLIAKNGNCIFQSKEPVLTENECDALIQEARQIIAQGVSDDSNNVNAQNRVTNSQLSEAKLSSMPQAIQWLQETLPTRLLPLLANRFGIPQQDLVLYDGLILGVQQAPSRSQPIHRDSSLLTMNIALSSPHEYQGGGTYLEALDETLVIERGHLLTHAGGLMHAGMGITSGERWVLVLFVLVKDISQVSRRCHAQALDHLQQNQVEVAKDYLETGLSQAPQRLDHLLQGTLGRIHLSRHETQKALNCFQMADQAYPTCFKALVSSARLLMDQKRPRAALRRWNQLLERLQDRDLQHGASMPVKALAWSARKDAAHCALLCAERNARQEDRSWSNQHLPVAIARIQTSLAPAPQEPNLLGMLARANVLLAESQASTPTSCSE